MDSEILKNTYSAWTYLKLEKSKSRCFHTSWEENLSSLCGDVAKTEKLFQI